MISNPCILCGKERVIVKKYRETIGSSIIINTITACSDSECQRKVDVMLANEKAKRQSIKEEFLVRESIRLQRSKIARKK